ncbi:MAG: HpcH/HpaI aldolase family protein [Chloroflexota bacterium]
MTLRSNLVKSRLAQGQVCRGVWLGLPDPFSVRLLAQLPVDWLLIDAEHSPIDAATLSLMVAAAAAGAGAPAYGPAPIVRLPDVTIENVKRALDAGTFGLLAPMINTARQAEDLVRWAKYPPQGQRSFGYAFAGLTFGGSMAEYLKVANQETLLAIQVESKDALDNLDELFCVPGIDMAFVGPVDLSVSLGLDPLPENPHPLFQEALAEIQAGARRHHMPLGIFCSSGAAARRRIAEGFQFVNVASDLGSLTANVLRELQASQLE